MKLDKSSAAEYLVRRYLSEADQLSLIIDEYHRPALVQFSAGAEEGAQPTVGDQIQFQSTLHMALWLLDVAPDSPVYHSVITRYLAAPKYHRSSTWILGVDVVPEERKEIVFVSNVQTLKLTVPSSQTRDEMIQRMLPTANDPRSLPIVFKLDSAGCYRGRIAIPGYISKPPVVPEIRNHSTKPALIFELLEQADPVFETAIVHSAKVYVGKRETEPRRLPPRSNVSSSDIRTFEANIFSVTGEEIVSSLRAFGQVLHDTIDTVTRDFRDRFDFSEYCTLLDICRGDGQWVAIVNSLCDKSHKRKYDDALYRRMAQYATRNDPNGFCKFVDSASSIYIERRVDVWAALLGLDQDNPTKADLFRAVKTMRPPEDEKDDPGETKIKIKKGKRRVGPKLAATIPVATDLTYNNEIFTLNFRGKQIKWTTQQFQQCTGATQMRMELYQVPRSAMEAQKLMIESLVKVAVQTSGRTLSVDIDKNFGESAMTESYEDLDRDALAEKYDSDPEVTRKWISIPSRAASKIREFELNKEFPPLASKKVVGGTMPYYKRVDNKISYFSNGVTTTVAEGDHISSMVGNLVCLSAAAGFWNNCDAAGFCWGGV
ncbi:hypothetical protein SARC_07282 [Sphaeroforma arctica JP610]|uniref:Uncharacterized protein n=1 Tax=Sphaeroforma arctica JP610 TaxID=667725 RepID=A0A0L0FUM2_9EUKA|nr:hypothetical protein SARC_07282 [Sphaeroforma arctica JP610]KNC80364.1 hypothetical protein SARC_07282 [Sphaeroforma arctica JP610]|eukprot:XP_014154266.1 hypothetical protein SARC_07282 [Sphaeroforma arctica JP610]